MTSGMTPGKKDTDEALVREAGRLLRDSAQHLDGATASRLNRARQAALAHWGHGAPPVRRAWWLPAGVAAAALAVLVVPRVLDQGQARTPLAGLQDPVELDLVLAQGDSLEMVEDLDFYLWLGEELEEPAPTGVPDRNGGSI
jgi:hypothetical protein